MFKKLRNYINNKGLCFSMQSKTKKVTVSICSDLDAARIETPYSNQLVEMNDIIQGLGQAYTIAQDAKDDKVMQEVHSVRQAISKVYD
jgi:hypothetical protein